MAQCPVCNSKLYIQRRFISKKKFICLACGWRMDAENVHRKGGLDKIKANLNNKNSHYHEYYYHRHRSRRLRP